MTSKLYSFWRSSAAFRVRIALNLKGMDYQIIPVHLGKNGGDQLGEEYGKKNPNRLVPLLEDGEKSIHQSLAIIEYLEEIQSEPALLPTLAIDRAWVRAIAMDIASDIHPINNLRVLRYLIKKLGISSEAKDEWYGSAKVDMKPYPTLMRIFHECMTLPAFNDASWEKQMDAEGLNPVAPPQK